MSRLSKEEVTAEVEICKIGYKSVLRIGEECVPIKDYKIISSKRFGTELEVVFQIDGDVLDFSVCNELIKQEGNT